MAGVSEHNAVMQRMRARLQEALQPTRLELRDDSAAHAGHRQHRAHGGGHFCLTIASPRFEGRLLPVCHRMVYDALGGMFSEEIHALSIFIERKRA